MFPYSTFAVFAERGRRKGCLWSKTR